MNGPDPLKILAYGPPITLAQARHIASAAEAEAVTKGWPMVIAIVDSGGHLVLLLKMDQAQLGSLAVAQRKAETAVAFRRPTRVFEQTLGEGGIHLRLLGMDILPIEGGVPLILDGQLVGAIGVSGMKAAEDGHVAHIAANAMTDFDRSSIGHPGSMS